MTSWERYSLIRKFGWTLAQVDEIPEWACMLLLRGDVP